MNLELLKQELPYKMKPGKMNKKTGRKSPDMAFIDARQVMDLLDEVVKPENWQCDYKELGGKMYCGIGIMSSGAIDGNYELDKGWVWKWDMGTESDWDPEKGEASDAFKRAAVKWGIGRFLYSLKNGTKKTYKSTARTATDTRDARPTDAQIKAVYFKMDSDSQEILKENVNKLKAGMASDYLGNKLTTEELLERIG